MDLRQKFFCGLGENTCSLKPALKSNALGLECRKTHLWRRLFIYFFKKSM